MRTTVTLDDDAAELAQTYARARSLRFGQALSEIIRKVTAPPLKVRKRGQAWVLQAPPSAPTITSEQVKTMLDDLP